MFDQLSRKQRARIMTVTRFHIAAGQDFEATKTSDKTLCKALDINPEAEPPIFLTDPRVLD